MAPTSQSKSLAMMFLLGAFLTGGVVGFTVDRAMTTKPVEARTQNSRQALAAELGLTDAQRVVVDSILRWRDNRAKEIYAPLRPLGIANRDSARTLIMQHLDSTQQRKFRDLIERQQAEADAKRRSQEQD